MVEFVERPWGAWKVVHVEDDKTVKMLTVNPGCMLSLQSHEHRAEYWQPLETGLVAYVESHSRHGDLITSSARLLKSKEIFQVDAGQLHRLLNPTDHSITAIETIIGTYDEEDIVRYHDAYGRL